VQQHLQLLDVVLSVDQLLRVRAHARTADAYFACICTGMLTHVMQYVAQGLKPPHELGCNCKHRWNNPEPAEHACTHSALNY
jgi:hypothetical protein